MAWVEIFFEPVCLKNYHVKVNNARSLPVSNQFWYLVALIRIVNFFTNSAFFLNTNFSEELYAVVLLELVYLSFVYL